MSQAVVEAYANSHNSTRQTLYTEGLNVLQNNYPTGVIHYPPFDILKYRMSRARSLNTPPIPHTYAAVPNFNGFPTGVIHYPLFDILKYRISRARSLNTSPIPNTYAAIPKLGSFRHN